MFEINYTQAEAEAAQAKEFGTFELVDDGIYETIITKAEERQANTGTKLIHIEYEIRKDFNQKFQGSVLQEPIWADKATNRFGMERIKPLAMTVGIASGTKFGSMKELCTVLLGLKVQVKTKIVTEKDRDGKEFKKNLISQKCPSKIGNNPYNSEVEEDLPF
jgi:hypothetical protein